eukprot:9013900-Pyramimonas_sp.AAC.1
MLRGTCRATCHAAVLRVSILMCRAEGCAVPGRPRRVETRVPLKTFPVHPHARHPLGNLDTCKR